MAEGFLHYFEGWVIFMICMAILFAEMWFLIKIGKNKRPWREVFGLEFPAATPKNGEARYRSIPGAYLVAGGLVVIATVFSLIIVKRVEAQPQRQALSLFPAQLEQWHGKQAKIEQIYLDQLKLDDYLMSDYMDKQGNWMNLYIAYYASQRKGHSVHSPRACIPGGGWEVQSFTQKNISEVVVNGAPLEVNRTVIQKGEKKQLVYYWFKQRDRIITNEYMVKWYLFWDALTRNRTDGALVRLTTVVGPSEEITAADTRLIGFAKLINKPIDNYIPD
jgi:exosortase D (VPLPA-CTERM-specific)